MSEPQQRPPPPQTVKFIVGNTYPPFIISKQAVMQRSPYFNWLFTSSDTIAAETGVVAIQEVEPRIFKYLEEYFNTGAINSLSDETAGAVLVLAKLWLLAEFAGISELQNMVMDMLHPALYRSPVIHDFFHYVYSIADRHPWSPPGKGLGESGRGADAVPKHALKVLAVRYAAWTFSRETLGLWVEQKDAMPWQMILDITIELKGEAEISRYGEVENYFV